MPVSPSFDFRATYKLPCAQEWSCVLFQKWSPNNSPLTNRLLHLKKPSQYVMGLALTRYLCTLQVAAIAVVLQKHKLADQQ